MKTKTIHTKKMIVCSLLIVAATALSIIMHAILPAPVDDLDFNSVFVRVFGFPAVATFYFFALFAHCVAAMHYYGKRADVSAIETGLRFGIVFAIIYLLGMQEVVVSASPFNEWGKPFVTYQFFMGLADAVPVILLCLVTANFTLKRNGDSSQKQILPWKDKVKAIVFILVAFVIVRTIGYETGIVTSERDLFPVPAYLWTLVFGIALGLIYVILYPVFSSASNQRLLSFKLCVLTVGVNWIIFNSFIGLIFEGVMLQMLLRSSLDILSLFIASIFLEKTAQ